MRGRCDERIDLTATGIHREIEIILRAGGVGSHDGDVQRGEERPQGDTQDRQLHPRRSRKLLMHRREINKIEAKLNQKGFTLVPLSIYFTRGIAKVELALCRGKTFGDKRQSKKDADVKRQLDRERSARRRDG